MRHFWATTALLAALGVTLDVAKGQDRESNSQASDSSEQNEQNESRSTSRQSRQTRDEQASDESDEQQTRRDRSGNRSQSREQQRSERNQNERSTNRQNRNGESRNQQGSDSRLGDDEIRLRYSDDANRLSIDVDEDIQFRDDRDSSGRDRGWARDGEFDLRYDTDRHDLRAAGEGTVDVDRAANSMARWWQSWWEEEKSARRSRQQGSESGARLFIRQHDENDDDYLSRRELPQNVRSEFARVDRNDDGYLSQTELRRYGDGMYQSAQRRSTDRRQTAATSRQKQDDSSQNQDEQTWSQWRSSWWSDQDNQGQASEQIASNGAREFIRKHDQNDDGFLVRSELPQQMYDDFDRLDTNGDRYLIRSEIQQQALRMNQNRSQSNASRSADQRR